jgi:hypothetical protein
LYRSSRVENRFHCTENWNRKDITGVNRWAQHYVMQILQSMINYWDGHKSLDCGSDGSAFNCRSPVFNCRSGYFNDYIKQIRNFWWFRVVMSLLPKPLGWLSLSVSPTHHPWCHHIDILSSYYWWHVKSSVIVLLSKLLKLPTYAFLSY